MAAAAQDTSFNKIDTTGSGTGRKTPPGRRAGLRHLAYGSIALLIAGGLAAMIYLFLSTTKAADTLALRHERALVSEALTHRLDLEARNQTFVAVNDKSAREVQVNDAIDPRFAREIARQMWLDFNHDWTLIVDGRNRPVLVAAEEEVVPLDAGLPILETTRDLIAKARIGYQTARRPSAGGYKIRYVEKGQLAPIYATDIREIKGQPALVSAMAIVPESPHVSLPDGPPGVILSISLIGPALLADIGTTLLLQNFAYQAEASSSPASVPVTAHDQTPLGAFTWTSEAPGSRIRAAIGPIALCLMLGFAGIGILFARHLARKSHALEVSEEHNRRLATQDILTGLANRSSFQETLASALRTCATTPCTVLAIDLDHFKPVNDTFGHDAGDMVIRQVAQRMRKVLSGKAVLARTGGDEFMALMAGPMDSQTLRWLCDALVEEIAQPIPVSGGLARIGVSIGWACAPAHADTPAHLLALADQALYRAKETGRNRAVSIEDLYRSASGEVPDQPQPHRRLIRT